MTDILEMVGGGFMSLWSWLYDLILSIPLVGDLVEWLAELTETMIAGSNTLVSAVSSALLALTFIPSGILVAVGTAFSAIIVLKIFGRG